MQEYQYSNNIFYNPIFLATVFSWFFTQFVKTIIIIILQPGQMPIRYYLGILLWKTGGMPSSHSAVATALATSIGFSEGFNSTVFIACSAYGLLVLRDAVGVRRSAGIQARTLNKLGLDLHDKLDIDYKPVKEISGHSVSEVLIGIVLGFFIAVAFSVL
ncbi:MAG: divergent PAP2 family protein [Spirochaetaceae bacterium]|nr:divergent PAP2 family protein [Spirochaetaceae bacterium]